MTDQPTGEICPSLYAHGDTHHAVPRREGKTHGEHAYTLNCQYCGATYRDGAWVPISTTTNTRRVQ
jgi:hypothetical protein